MSLYRCTVTVRPACANPPVETKPEFLVESDSPISASVIAESVVIDASTSRKFLVSGVIVNIEDGDDFFILKDLDAG